MCAAENPAPYRDEEPQGPSGPTGGKISDGPGDRPPGAAETGGPARAPHRDPHVVGDPVPSATVAASDHVAIRLWDHVAVQTGEIAQGVTIPRALLSLFLGVVAECLVLLVHQQSGWVAFATLLFVSITSMNAMRRPAVCSSSSSSAATGQADGRRDRPS